MLQQPKRPTLRGATLDGENFKRIKDTLEMTLEEEGRIYFHKLIYFGIGFQYIRENEQGGFVNAGGTRNKYPTISFEVQVWARKKSTGRKSTVYLQGWIGGYGKGSIVHFGWQYPHCDDFVKSELEIICNQVYYNIASLVYGNRDMPNEILAYHKYCLCRI